MGNSLRAPVCVVLALVAAGFAAQKIPARSKPGTALSATLENKVRQGWADYQLKRKAAFAAILTDDFIAVGEDGAGPRDKKSELNRIDQFDLAQYALTSFKVKPLGAESALVMYIAEYSGTAAGQPVRAKVAVGEIWVRRGGAWKLTYEQMTSMS